MKATILAVLLAVLTISAAASGCGQTGPLYVPESPGEGDVVPQAEEDDNDEDDEGPG